MLSVSPMIVCPHPYCLSSVVFICLCFFFLGIFPAVHHRPIIGNWQKFSLRYLETIVIFVERLYLANLFDYLMIVQCHQFLFPVTLISFPFFISAFSSQSNDLTLLISKTLLYRRILSN